MDSIYDEICRLKRRMEVLHMENMVILQYMLPNENYRKIEESFRSLMASRDELGNVDNGKDN